MSRAISSLHLGAWMCLAAFPAFGAASVKIVGMEGRLQQAPQIPAVFGGSEQKIDLKVEGVPERIGTSLYADFFQVAGDLTRPIATHARLDETFGLAPSSPDSERVILKFPVVKNPVQILVRLTVLKKTAQPNGGLRADSVAVGTLRFEVFPSSVTRDLAELLKAKADGRPVASIFGPGPKLRAFFKSIPIPFEDGGVGTPDRLDPDRYYFVEAANLNQVQTATDRRTGCRMAVFFPDDALPEGIYAEQNQAGAYVRVTSSLLDSLEDDPRAQLALIKIIRLLSTRSLPN